MNDIDKIINVNSDKKREYYKEYYKNNKTKIKEIKKRHYEKKENKDKQLIQMRQYYKKYIKKNDRTEYYKQKYQQKKEKIMNRIIISDYDRKKIQWIKSILSEPVQLSEEGKRNKELVDKYINNKDVTMKNEQLFNLKYNQLFYNQFKNIGVSI